MLTFAKAAVQTPPRSEKYWYAFCIKASCSSLFLYTAGIPFSAWDTKRASVRSFCTLLLSRFLLLLIIVTKYLGEECLVCISLWKLSLCAPVYAMINIEAHVYVWENLPDCIADGTAIVSNRYFRVGPAKLVATSFDAFQHLNDLHVWLCLAQPLYGMLALLL